VPHHRWFLAQGTDDLGGVIGDLLQGLPGQDARVGPGLFNRFRVAAPNTRAARHRSPLRPEVRHGTCR